MHLYKHVCIHVAAGYLPINHKLFWCGDLWHKVPVREVLFGARPVGLYKFLTRALLGVAGQHNNQTRLGLTASRHHGSSMPPVMPMGFGKLQSAKRPPPPFHSLFSRRNEPISATLPWGVCNHPRPRPLALVQTPSKLL